MTLLHTLFTVFNILFRLTSKLFLGGVIQKSTVSGFGSSKVVTEKVSNTKNKNYASNTATTQDVQQDQERELDAHFEQIASMYAMEIQQKLYVKLKCSNCVTIIVVTISSKLLFQNIEK